MPNVNLHEIIYLKIPLVKSVIEEILSECSKILSKLHLCRAILPSF